MIELQQFLLALASVIGVNTSRNCTPHLQCLYFDVGSINVLYNHWESTSSLNWIVLVLGQIPLLPKGQLQLRHVFISLWYVITEHRSWQPCWYQKVQNHCLHYKDKVKSALMNHSIFIQSSMSVTMNDSTIPIHIYHDLWNYWSALFNVQWHFQS